MNQLVKGQPMLGNDNRLKVLYYCISLNKRRGVYCCQHCTRRYSVYLRAVFIVFGKLYYEFEVNDDNAPSQVRLFETVGSPTAKPLGAASLAPIEGSHGVRRTEAYL